MDLLYKDEVYAIIGAAMNVHNELGCGFLEAVYQEALEKEFSYQNIPYKREAPLKIFYRGKPLNKQYTADFICYDKIILELKAASSLLPEHQSQILNYLAASQLKLGILINFGQPKLECKRIISEHSRLFAGTGGQEGLC
jgi:GxxExxY protein